MKIVNWEEIEEVDNRRQRWMDELKSGVYIQGQGALLNVSPEGNKEYCCLGVACATFGTELSLYSFDADTDGYSSYVGYSEEPDNFQAESETSSYLVLTPKTMKYLALSDSSMRILTTLNDNGVAFEIIAEVIMNLPFEVEDES